MTDKKLDYFYSKDIVKNHHQMTVDEIIEASKCPSNMGVSVLINGRWCAAKPVYYEPLPWKLKRFLKRIERAIFK